MLNATLAAIRDLGGSASIQELDDAAIAHLNLAESDLTVPHGERGTEVGYRLAWARSYLKAYGVLDNSARGVWSLTAKGQETHEVDPGEVVRQVREQHRARRHRTPRKGSRPPEVDIDEEVRSVEDWRVALSARLMQLPPPAFERLCQRLLREAGFVQVEVTGRSGDGGIDGIGIVRLGGLLGFPIMFQCKRYRGAVPPSAIRDFRGAVIGRADRGLMITTGTFSRDARQEATRDGALPIDLLDGDELLDKLKELRLGVHVEMIERVSLSGEWFESL